MTDPYKEGYVGITKLDLEERFKYHKRSHSKCSVVRRAIDKYDDITIEMLHDVEADEALLLEEQYRPSEKLGWNICKGGGYPPRNSEETKEKISQTIKQLGVVPYDKNKTHSPEAIAKANKKRIGRKWTYNPVTGEQKMRKPEDLPEGWKFGRIH
jgi:hypothetical protein